MNAAAITVVIPMIVFGGAAFLIYAIRIAFMTYDDDQTPWEYVKSHPRTIGGLVDRMMVRLHPAYYVCAFMATPLAQPENEATCVYCAQVHAVDHDLRRLQ